MISEIQKIATENWDMSNILNTLLLSKKFMGYVFQGYKVNINYGYDLIKAAYMIGKLERNLFAIDPSVKFLGRTELRNNVSIGRNSIVDEGVHISNSIILEGTKIEKGATVTDSVVGPNSKIESLVRRKMIINKIKADLTESPY